MIKSMTGYGRSQKLLGGRDITVEIKAVNHRYFEFNSRVPRSYAYLEEKLKSHIQKSVFRGKVDVNITVINLEGTTTQVEINKPLAAAYVSALRDLGSEQGLSDDLSLSTISRFGDIFTLRKTVDSEDEVWQDVKTVCDDALAQFIRMREAEGEGLKADILSRLLVITEHVKAVEEKSPETLAKYRQKLYDKMSEILADKKIEEQRILTEAAIFSEKIAVDEETVRLKSHIAQCQNFLESTEAIGRKLDFLMQEFNREANTIGSKAQDIEVSKIVVEIKSELEKIREQVQNIE